MTKYLDEEGTKYLIEKLSGNSGGGIEYYEFDQIYFKFSDYGLTDSSIFIVWFCSMSNNVGNSAHCYIKLSSTNVVIYINPSTKLSLVNFNGINTVSTNYKGGLIIFKR